MRALAQMDEESMNVAILLSGGTGRRLGANIPKQYIRVAGKQIITYALEVLAKAPMVDAIVVVAGEEWRDKIELPKALCAGVAGAAKPLLWAEPGANRQLSIYNGMKAAMELEPTTVLVHDAARPLLPLELMTAMYEALPGHDGVMPALPMKDTVYLLDEVTGAISKTLPRAQLAAGQAPELFMFKPYFQAVEALLPDAICTINGTSEPAILAGLNVVTVVGDEKNIKITTEADLEKFKEMME